MHVGLGFLMVTDSKLQRSYSDEHYDGSVMKFAGINWSLYMSSQEIFQYSLQKRFHSLDRTHIMIYCFGGASIAAISMIFLFILSCKKRSQDKTVSTNYLEEINISILRSLYNRARYDLTDFESLFEIADDGVSFDSLNLKLNFSDMQSVISGKTAHRRRRQTMTENPKSIE